ncbi:HK97 family phage prohead protease [Carboxylicivirga sp. M1479]|uniref:HK97 family phage prohead protease n=1 Tax=Carboxylicivirga sp. M1479 TaxID=2594476 RepID=UPI00117737EF|nr:HK97 family phage prohead protease [Carboxylicivirga sp. M1479]TRX71512.1 hypothetical protein FNN09_05955 [Carboxylicivirga sp. M1479]
MEINDRNVKGYPIVFNSLSNTLETYIDGWVEFNEITLPTSFANINLGTEDIILNIEHNDSMILARNINGKGLEPTLRLEIDSTGLFIDADVPDTQLGTDVLKMLNRGDLTQMSSRFRVAKDRWYRDANDRLIREIQEFKHIRDVSLVSRPAYSMTVAQEDKRSLETFLLDEKRQIQEKDEDRNTKNDNNVALSEYYILKNKYMR